MKPIDSNGRRMDGRSLVRIRRVTKMHSQLLYYSIRSFVIPIHLFNFDLRTAEPHTHTHTHSTVNRLFIFPYRTPKSLILFTPTMKIIRIIGH